MDISDFFSILHELFFFSDYFCIFAPKTHKEENASNKKGIKLSH